MTASHVELPPVPPAGGAYDVVRRAGTALHVSGQVAVVDGWVVQGRVGEDVSTAQAAELAGRCALQAVAAAAEEVGDLNRLRAVRLRVFVAAIPSYTEHPVVADGASTALRRVLQKHGDHARTAVGVASLPLGVPVEVELELEVLG